MRSIPPALTAILEAREQYIARLLSLALPSGILRYTTLDIEFYFGGNFYLPKRFTNDRIAASLQSEIDAMMIRIDNADLSLTSLFTTAAVRGRICSLTDVGLIYPATIVDSALVFQGLIDSVRFDDSTVQISVYSPMILWKRKCPRRIYQPSCPWKFKGEECKYEGTETWCDQDVNRCWALGNRINFGGFRWLPSIINRSFHWGK